MGFPLFLSFESAESSAAFSFGGVGAKEKANKEEKNCFAIREDFVLPAPFGEFRALRSARRATRPPLRRLLRKENLQAGWAKTFHNLVCSYNVRYRAYREPPASRRREAPIGVCVERFCCQGGMSRFLSWVQRVRCCAFAQKKRGKFAVFPNLKHLLKKR